MEELPETLIMDFDLDASWTFDQIFSIEDWPPAMEELPETLIVDFDLDASWTFDQIFSIEDWPPVILSAIDQPSSPVRTFSENNNNNNLVDGDAEPVEYAPLTSFRASRTIIANPMPIFEVNPTQYADATSVIKEQMTMALHYFKELGEKHILAQIWAPVKNGGCNVLTTCGQPFVLDPNCTGLHQYRMASSMYVFPLDSETDGVLDIPGRVFRHKLPEWTPNVQYYSDKEYQRLDHALNYNVRGTLALPVFEPSGQSCVGVLELILTSQKINYAPEVDKVCKALEAVNLKSSNILDSPNTQICNESRQQALAEILEVLAVVCETHNFPLAQTWVPCRHRSVLAYGGGFKKSCNSFDGSCMGQVCMSTTDVAFYVVDAHMWGFREACAEHHLQKGQGVAGRAFAKRSSCFCENITHFGKTEYPLVHYARMFGLVGSFAICLRSTHTGDDDYILEFFLPPYIIDCKDQKVMLSSVLALMKQHFRTLEFASGKELDDELRILDIEDSSRSQIEFSMTFERNRSATLLEASEEGRRSIDKECRTPSTEKYKTAPISLPQEDIEQQFGRTMKEAANNLNVSLSTLKRRCTYFGISEWQGPKFVKRKVNETDKGATRDSLAIDGGMQVDKNTLIIKAEYADDLIKFQLPISLATVVAIEKEICDRFKLSRETYKLKYKDEDEEWILMTYDQDLRDCIKSLKNSNSTAIRLRVIPLI